MILTEVLYSRFVRGSREISPASSLFNPFGHKTEVVGRRLDVADGALMLLSSTLSVL